MIPKTFIDKLEDWRSWHEEVEDYLDTVNPGIKRLLEFIDKEKDVVDGERDGEWMDLRARTGHCVDVETNRYEQYPEKVLGDKVNLWRALKKLTEGEAKKIVTSVKKEDGFRAWQKLRLRFEPSLAAKQGLVIAEFSGMVTNPAKAPQDTVSLMTDMDKRMKLI